MELGTIWYEGQAYHVWLDGVREPRAIEADVKMGYVVSQDTKGTWDNKYGTYVRKRQGKVELIHIYTGAVVT